MRGLKTLPKRMKLQGDLMRLREIATSYKGFELSPVSPQRYSSKTRQYLFDCYVDARSFLDRISQENITIVLYSPIARELQGEMDFQWRVKVTL